jgi:large subunit ribosomal protein LP1
MSTVAIDKLSKEELAGLACTYAALILHDENLEINATKISSLLKAANVQIEGFWPKLFSKTIASRNINDLLVAGGSGSSSAPATTTSAPAATGKPAAAAPAAKAPPKVEKGKRKHPKKTNNIYPIK